MADTQIAELMGRLHRIHRQISELNGRLKKGSRLIILRKEKRDQALTALTAKKQENNALLLTAKEKEKALNAAEDAINKRRTQLNEAKNNKEFSALKTQISIDEKALDILSDEALAAMVSVEDFAVVIDKLDKEYQEAYHQVEQAEQDWAQKKPGIEEDLARCSQLLKEAENELTKDFKPLYKRLVDGYGGEEALSPVVDSTYCGFCNQKIPLHFVNEVLAGKPVVCPACGRLLYIPEGFTL